MNTKENLGIWMDYSTANIIDINNPQNNRTTASNFTSNIQEEALSKNERFAPNKEQHLHQDYYNDIAEDILNYFHVVIFGPTNAKSELHNYLSNNQHFRDIKIDVEPADKMTDIEKEAFVKKYFEY